MAKGGLLGATMPGGGMSIDGLTQQNTGTKFDDLTMHSVVIFGTDDESDSGVVLKVRMPWQVVARKVY